MLDKYLYLIFNPMKIKYLLLLLLLTLLLLLLLLLLLHGVHAFRSHQQFSNYCTFPITFSLL